MPTPADAATPQPGSPQPGSPQQNAPEQGVIHDIGYRRYTGARLGRGPVRTALFLDTLRGCFGLGRAGKAKVMPAVLTAMVVLPALSVVFYANVTGGTDLPFSYREYVGSITTLVFIYVAGQAPQAVSRDLRFRTISLYFSRPIPRSDYVLAKFAAMSSAVMIFCVLPLLVLYIGALLAKMPVGEQTADFLKGLALALLFSLVVAGLGLVIASVTPKRGFGVAAIVTVLLLADSLAGVVITVAEHQNNPTLSWYGGLLSPLYLVDSALAWVLSLDGGRLNDQLPPDALGGLVFVAVLLAVIVGNYLLLNLRYRKVSVS
ncbi:MAG: type transport system permease protein [Actinomycetota bacterium]|nr:type transport system permease protein [Actinomycetota bacterium]